MKRIVLLLSAIGLVVLGLAGVVPGLPPQVGVQTAVQADTETTHHPGYGASTAARSTTLRGLTLDQIVRGDSFIVNGKIFRAGTLPAGTQSNDPNDPGSIGTYVSRGTSTGTLAEHLPIRHHPASSRPSTTC